jgi:hypothetical protein
MVPQLLDCGCAYIRPTGIFINKLAVKFNDITDPFQQVLILFTYLHVKLNLDIALLLNRPTADRHRP